MKLSKKNQLIIFSSIAAFTSSIVLSRNRFQPGTDRFLEQVSQETADKWEPILGLSFNQKKLMQKKISNFAGKKNAVILSRKSNKSKTALLQKLQELENQEMRSILNNEQFEIYLLTLTRSIKGEQVNAQNWSNKIGEEVTQ
jgi:CMP-2-keto-3-deoxyoctulosonic acid synthetase